MLLLSLCFAADASWTLSVDPLTAALGYAHIQVERVLAPGFSVYAGPHLRLYDPPWAQEHEAYIGLGGELGLRWFPRAEAPEGPWLMTRGVLAHLRTTDDSADPTLGGYGSALAGWTWLLAGDHLVLAAGAGAQRIHYQIGDYGPNGWFPALHTNLGVAF